MNKLVVEFSSFYVLVVYNLLPVNTRFKGMQFLYKAVEQNEHCG